MSKDHYLKANSIQPHCDSMSELLSLAEKVEQSLAKLRSRRMAYCTMIVVFILGIMFSFVAGPETNIFAQVVQNETLAYLILVVVTGAVVSFSLMIGRSIVETTENINSERRVLAELSAMIFELHHMVELELGAVDRALLRMRIARLNLKNLASQASPLVEQPSIRWELSEGENDRAIIGSSKLMRTTK